MLKKKTGNSEELYGDLGQYFNFTRGDLEANRAGFISHRQKKFSRKDLVLGILLLQGCTFIFAMTAFLLFSRETSPNTGYNNSLSCLGAFFTFAAIVMFGGSALVIYNLFADFRKRRVSFVDCELIISETNHLPYLDSKTRHFGVTLEQAQILKAKNYRVYYLPQAELMLSLEELQDD